MNSIRRLVVNVQARIDQVISHMENHQALAAVAIEELEATLRDARARYRSLQLEQGKLEGRIRSLKEEAGRWAERARRVHGSDPDDALECVRRMKRAERQAAALAEHQARQLEGERALGRKLARTEERLVELRGKRSALAAREASVNASEAVARVDGAEGIGAADSIFERWEVELAGREPLDEPEADPFAKQFEDAEHEAELREALEELVSKKPS